MTGLAVLTAAGSGTRLGANVPKALVKLGGVSLVVRAARGLAASGVVDTIVVTTHPEDAKRFAALFPGGRVTVGAADEQDAANAGAVTGVGEATWEADRVHFGRHSVRVLLVPGGGTRQDSVARGLAAGLDADPDADVVLIHDAARCLTPPEMVASVAEAVRQGHDAVIPALPVTDTIKQVGEPNEYGAEPVEQTVNRRVLRAVQTPQGFARDLIERAHREGASRAMDEATAASDDAALVEALGERVWVVAGDERAMKITTPRDLAVAKLLLHG